MRWTRSRARPSTRRSTGILLNNNVGRVVVDAEAAHSCEGTRKINTLIAGPAITGLGAYV